MWVKKEQLEPDMELIGSKLGKESDKAMCCHPTYLTCMYSASCKMPDWRKHKMELRLPEEISSCLQMIPLKWWRN